MKKSLLTLILFLIGSISIHLTAQICMPAGTIVLNTQVDVDAFIANYGNCDSITGNLDIQNNANVTNLDSLKNIRYIGGRLQVNNNTALTNIDGLKSLEYIRGLVSIRNNPLLENVDGLCALHTVIGAFAITGNASLKNLHGLKALQSIGSNLRLFDNNMLTNFDGLNNLRSVRGIVTIRNNVSLENIDGLSNLASIGRLELYSNPRLATCCGLFRALDDVDDDFPGPGVAPTWDISGSITINSNLPGCNNQAEILNAGICQDPPPVPTLSQWGLLLFGMLVLTLGVVGIWNLYYKPSTAL